MINIRPVKVEEAAHFRKLRLYGLQESPTAFGRAYDEEVLRPLAHTITRLKNQQQPNNFVMGAFEADQLAGVAGFLQYEGLKERHKSMIWGVYVHPDFRGRGIARRLMEAILEQVKSLPSVKQIHLTVMNDNAIAKTLYRRLGFVEWGIEPRALLIDGVYYDEAHMVYRLD